MRMPDPIQVDTSEGSDFMTIYVHAAHGGDDRGYMPHHPRIWVEEVWDEGEGDEISFTMKSEGTSLKDATLEVKGVRKENWGKVDMDVLRIRGNKKDIQLWVIDWEEAAVEGGPRGADDDHADYFPAEWAMIGQVMNAVGILTQKDWDEWTMEIADRHYGAPGEGYYDEFISGPYTG